MSYLTIFEVPEVASPLVPRFLGAHDIALIESFGGQEFTAEDAIDALNRTTGHAWSVESAQALLADMYRRGVLNRATDGREAYTVGTFYGWLETFVVSQADAYNALTPEEKTGIDSWCFETYLTSLDDTNLPTSDKVVTVDALHNTLDNIGEQIWLSPCDCRTLAGGCHKPLDVCISWKSGINSRADRGWAKPISKAEAKEIVSDAHRKGLMQTVNDHGICNCCSDCCYLFRAQSARDSVRVWPSATEVASFDSTKCTTCKACLNRCPFDAFSLVGGAIQFDVERCRGCSVCVSGCKSSAISMVPLSSVEDVVA